VQSALVTGDTADSVRREVNSRRRAGELALQQRLQRAKREADLPADADLAVLARYPGQALSAVSATFRKSFPLAPPAAWTDIPFVTVIRYGKSDVEWRAPSPYLLNLG
jgi:hypothetical protein